jgi:hypothetical protein
MKLKDLFSIILGPVNIITTKEVQDEAYSNYAKIYGCSKVTVQVRTVWTGLLYNPICPTKINEEIPEEYWDMTVTEIEPTYKINNPGDYQPNIDLAINIHIE